MKRVLVVGGGAREHALCWRLAQDGAEVHVTPGNAGCASVATVHSVSATDIDGLVVLARELNVALVVVGPEAPLVLGLVDQLKAVNISVFGPDAKSAQLEGSKTYSKERMARFGVPTADFAVFDDADAADVYIREAARPLVVKADGLAAGKGVVVAKDTAEALAAVDHIMRKRAFGDAGARVLVEECLVGEEISYHVLCSGASYVPLAAAQDHKRAFDGDLGPNTGGMGAYSPPPVMTPELEARIRSEIVEPMLQGLVAEGTPFMGVLFIGLMVSDGEPSVLEFNVRFGDPECEVLMARWKGPFLDVLEKAARGDLESFEPTWAAPAAMTVVLASPGYPGAYPKGAAIEGLGLQSQEVTVFHAGTALDGERIVTSGGRVLAITATGESIESAREAAYARVESVHFEGKQFRTDIGWRARGSEN